MSTWEQVSESLWKERIERMETLLAEVGRSCASSIQKELAQRNFQTPSQSFGSSTSCLESPTRREPLMNRHGEILQATHSSHFTTTKQMMQHDKIESVGGPRYTWSVDDGRDTWDNTDCQAFSPDTLIRLSVGTTKQVLMSDSSGAYWSSLPTTPTMDYKKNDVVTVWDEREKCLSSRSGVDGIWNLDRGERFRILETDCDHRGQWYKVRYESYPAEKAPGRTLLGEEFWLKGEDIDYSCRLEELPKKTKNDSSTSYFPNLSSV